MREREREKAPAGRRTSMARVPVMEGTLPVQHGWETKMPGRCGVRQS